MAIEIQSFSNASMDIEKAGNTLADDLLKEKGFAITFKGWTSEGYVVKLSKSGFLRQFSGLTYTLEIMLQRQENVVIVKVDDGNIKNQLIALGVAWIIFLPVLISAGYGWMHKGAFRKEVLEKIKKIFTENG
jgi:hypothetical protein